MFLVGNVFFPDLYSFSFLENREEFKNHLIVSFCFSIMILHAIEQNKSSREAIVNHVCLTWHLSETYGQNCSDSSGTNGPESCKEIYLYIWTQDNIKNSEQTMCVCVWHEYRHVCTCRGQVHNHNHVYPCQ